eukprot:1817867-Prymnesium_polylepis.1
MLPVGHVWTKSAAMLPRRAKRRMWLCVYTRGCWLRVEMRMPRGCRSRSCSAAGADRTMVPKMKVQTPD